LATASETITAVHSDRPGLRNFLDAAAINDGGNRVAKMRGTACAGRLRFNQAKMRVYVIRFRCETDGSPASYRRMPGRAVTFGAFDR
jgi:hypothetical protein